MRGVWNWIVTRTADYGLPKQIELIDIVQILLIAFFVYHLIRWLQNTKAYTLMKGIFLIGVFVIIANVLKMQTILWPLAKEMADSGFFSPICSTTLRSSG